MDLLFFGFKQAIVSSLTWILPTIALISIGVYLVTKFLPSIIPAARIVHYISIPILLITVFFTGVNWNESRWLAELKLEQEKVIATKQEQEKLNQQLIKERELVTSVLEKSSNDLRTANARFILELQKKDSSVAGLLSSLDQVTREKYAALDQVQKAEYDKQLQNIIDFEKKCPIIPELYINKLNNRAKNIEDVKK